MKQFKILPLLAAFILGVTLFSPSAFAHGAEVHTATSTNGYDVMVMKHLCKSTIKNMDDFRALEAGRDPVAALANTVLNCPTTGLPGDLPVEGTVASPRATYDFSVKGEHYGAEQLSTDGHFMQHKLSEADINKDVDGNGMILATTALDISHYEFANLMADNGRVEVTENMPPAGYKFGALRFTPPAIDGNNDEQALRSIDEAQGRIQLDLSQDKDKMIMLHVYNFATNTNTSNNGGTNGGSATTTRAETINQINSLQQQINALFSQIQNLLRQL